MFVVRCAVYAVLCCVDIICSGKIFFDKTIRKDNFGEFFLFFYCVLLVVGLLSSKGCDAAINYEISGIQQIARYVLLIEVAKSTKYKPTNSMWKTGTKFVVHFFFLFFFFSFPANNKMCWWHTSNRNFNGRLSNRTRTFFFFFVGSMTGSVHVYGMGRASLWRLHKHMLLSLEFVQGVFKSSTIHADDNNNNQRTQLRNIIFLFSVHRKRKNIFSVPYNPSHLHRSTVIVKQISK